MKILINKIWQRILECNCIIERHMWHRINKGIKCSRCGKKLTIATKSKKIK